MSLKGNVDGQTLVGSINKCDVLTISAYGIAVKNGFEGTEEEWLASLKGDSGYTPVKGVDFFDGAPGYTPVKGVDYWTEADKQEIAGEMASPIVNKATGETILLTDSAEQKFRGLKLYGKHEQFTTTGAQLLQLDDVTKSNNGINAVVKNGAVAISGTTTDGASVIILKGAYDGAKDVIGLPSGDYKLTGDYLNVQIRKADGTTRNTNPAYSLTLADGEYIVCVFLYISKGTAVNTTVYPMISAGTTALPWEPYTGGKPSPSPEYPQEIVPAGADGNITVTIDGATPQTLTVLTPNGLPGIKVPSGGNYTDSTGQQRICDEVDYGRGKNVERLTLLTIDYVDKVDSTGKLFGITKNTLLFDGTSGNEILCDQYSHASIQAARNADYAITMYGYDIWLRNKDYATIEDFNTALAAKPIKVLAPLATPIETPLTEEELAQYRQLLTNYPITTILNDEGVDMEVSYVADTKNYIDKKFTELAAAIVANA